MESNLTDRQKQERFIASLSAMQSSIWRYIYSLLPDPNLANDVLQETNIVLWRKIDEFDHSREFMPWARQIARFQVMAALRDRSRDRLVLDEGLVDLMAGEIEAEEVVHGARMKALEKCLSKLNSNKRELVLQRYRDGASVQDIAASLKRPVGSLSQALYRIRQALMRCVERQLSSTT